MTEEIEYVRVASNKGKPDRPQQAWIRGKCPECGDDLVSNCYWYTAAGDEKPSYHIVWECWSSLAQPATCGYRHVL